MYMYLYVHYLHNTYHQAQNTIHSSQLNASGVDKFKPCEKVIRPLSRQIIIRQIRILSNL